VANIFSGFTVRRGSLTFQPVLDELEWFSAATAALAPQAPLWRASFFLTDHAMQAILVSRAATLLAGGVALLVALLLVHQRWHGHLAWTATVCRSSAALRGLAGLPLPSVLWRVTCWPALT
jgi:hypothetical protein